MGLDKDTIFESFVHAALKEGFTCLNCAFRDVNECQHAEMKINQDNRFHIPHPDFLCKYWIQEKI
jgi:hypothetical protein